MLGWRWEEVDATAYQKSFGKLHTLGRDQEASEKPFKKRVEVWGLRSAVYGAMKTAIFLHKCS